MPSWRDSNSLSGIYSEIARKFTDEDIEFLRSKGIFDDRFLEYLRDFEFACDVWAVPEGNAYIPGRTDNNGKRTGDAGAVS